MDTNGDGNIDKDELMIFLERLAAPVGVAATPSITAVADATAATAFDNSPLSLQPPISHARSPSRDLHLGPRATSGSNNINGNGRCLGDELMIKDSGKGGGLEGAGEAKEDKVSNEGEQESSRETKTDGQTSIALIANSNNAATEAAEGFVYV